MNEQIKLLADKVSDDISIREMPFKTWYDEFTEKFAELIVSECIRLCDQVDLVGADDCIDNIKEHFGVNE